jgi:hypothetical protein
MKQKLITYVRAGYPGLFVVSAEEARAEAVLKEVATELGRRLHAWSITEGFINTESGSIREAPDPLEALNEIDRQEDNQMVVLRDYHLLPASRFRESYVDGILGPHSTLNMPIKWEA